MSHLRTHIFFDIWQRGIHLLIFHYKLSNSGTILPSSILRTRFYSCVEYTMLHSQHNFTLNGYID